MCSLPMARYYIVKGADQRALYVRDGQLLVGDPEADSCSAETACLPLQKRPCRMQAFRIWDVNQKTFYLRNNQLIAGYLQGPNIKLEEKIDMLSIEPHAVFLGIHGRKLCLACVKSGSKIRLQLEPVNITDLSQNKEQDKRFTFIHSDSGATTSFESAACPGWFLCTALEADRPVSLTNTPEEAIMVTKFYFRQDQ
ncbi:interleukin-1 family member 10 isoform X3 [Manis pentadactyla]|uniref:interleukin-1 family member 10 isoform X3 n=1 Tax=Manis pentadactyla TaxID=143292 RepID=UPI00255CC9B4|nr:interleukin-1 family member 10 isoform X3 [Manis pentadactyla]XP_057352998.1 interleukin-1 family member 10 isoform X3 [Manis pentadactyla]